MNGQWDGVNTGLGAQAPGADSVFDFTQQRPADPMPGWGGPAPASEPQRTGALPPHRGPQQSRPGRGPGRPAVSRPASRPSPAELSGPALSLAMVVVVGVAAYLGGDILPLTLAALVLMFSAGWGSLLQLPDPYGSTVVVLLPGLAALAAVTLGVPVLTPILTFAAVIAASLMLAFVHEILRGKNRSSVVESVTGTVSGAVIAMVSAGWIMLVAPRGGSIAILIAVIAMGAGLLVRWVVSLSAPGWVVPWATVAAGIVAAIVAGMLFKGDTHNLSELAVLGGSVAGCPGALERVLRSAPGKDTALGLISAAIAPVLIGGIVAESALRLVGI